MYYLVDVEIFRTFDTSGAEYEKLQRLVKAKDKNTAWNLTKKYLDGVYVSNRTGMGIKYNICVNDTIIE